MKSAMILVATIGLLGATLGAGQTTLRYAVHCISLAHR